jgi:hypothetical protein
VSLRELGVEAEDLAQRVRNASPDSWQSEEGVSALIESMERLEQVKAESDLALASLECNADLHRISLRLGYDRRCQLAREGVRDTMAKVAAMKAEREARKLFADGCSRIEYLCDHPPEHGSEAAWIADMQRTEADLRHCCQERPDLVVPTFLIDRGRRAVAALDSRTHHRRRFTLVVAASTTLVLLGLAAVAGTWQWRRADKEAAVGTLQAQLAAIRLGGLTKRPAACDTIAAEYAGDARVAAIVAECDAALEAERTRQQRFRDALAVFGDLHERGRQEIAERTGTDEALGPWPDAVRQCVLLLAEARGIGGLPEERGMGADASPSSSEARQHLQQEEALLAAAERRLAADERELERQAVAAFTSRRDSLAEDLGRAKTAEAVRVIRRKVAALRGIGGAPRADQATVERLIRPRVPDAVSAELDILETRATTVGREFDRQ